MPALPFCYRRRVRWGDGDPALIAYTVRFVDYAMEAAEEWCRQVLGVDWYRLTVEQRSGAPVVHLSFDFQSPLRPGDEVDVEVFADAPRGASVTLYLDGYRVAAGGERTPSFSAKLVQCFVSVDDVGGGVNAIPVPEDYQQRAQAYAERCTAAGKEPAARRTR